MSTPILSGARLLFRVDPLPRESPRGYLCRVAEAHGYCGPLALAQIAGLPTSGLERDDSVKQIAHVLRLEPEEWQAMHYRHIGGRNRFDQRSFYGQRISVDDLNYERPRICPRCLKEAPIWWAVWDLGLVTACPIHRCHLVNQCPACKRRLAWQRPSVHKCRCGLDLRALTAEAATPDLVAINAAIYKAAGFPPGEGAELDLADRGFPPEMLRLSLGALLRLILFIGSIREKDKLRRKQRPFAATDLAVATEIDRGADRGAERMASALTRSTEEHAPAGSHRSGLSELQQDLREFLPPPVSCSSAQRIRIPSRCLRELCNRRLEGSDPRPAPILFSCRAAEFPLDDRG